MLVLDLGTTVLLSSFLFVYKMIISKPSRKEHEAAATKTGQRFDQKQLNLNVRCEEYEPKTIWGQTCPKIKE